MNALMRWFTQGNRQYFFYERMNGTVVRYEWIVPSDKDKIVKEEVDTESLRTTVERQELVLRRKNTLAKKLTLSFMKAQVSALHSKYNFLNLESAWEYLHNFNDDEINNLIKYEQVLTEIRNALEFRQAELKHIWDADEARRESSRKAIVQAMKGLLKKRDYKGILSLKKELKEL